MPLPPEAAHAFAEIDPERVLLVVVFEGGTDSEIVTQQNWSNRITPETAHRMLKAAVETTPVASAYMELDDDGVYQEMSDHGLD